MPNPEERLSPQVREDLAARRIEYKNDAAYHALLQHVAHRLNTTIDEAEAAATSVLCLLDQQIRAQRSGDPEEHVPYSIRKFFAACTRPGEPLPLTFDSEELITSVAADLDVDEERAETIIRAVFAALRHQVPTRDSEVFASRLPARVQNLWFDIAQ